MNTPSGLLWWNRLPFGIKTASAIFQSEIVVTLDKVVSNMIIYQDDICVGTLSEDELSKSAKDTLDAEKRRKRINEQKSVLCSTELSFLGHCISASGVRPDQSLVQKVLSIKKPGHKKELNSYLGLVNYYGRYIEGFAETIAPL